MSYIVPNVPSLTYPLDAPQWFEPRRVVSLLGSCSWWATTHSGRPRKDASARIDELYLSEREVESALVEPLLIKIGYRDSDWNCRVRIKGDEWRSLAPDYVIGWEPETGRAVMVLEAKRNIKSMINLLRSIDQLKLYTGILKPLASAIVSPNGIWAFDARVVEYRYTHWSKLHELSVVDGIRAVIGPRALGIIRHRCRLSQK